MGGGDSPERARVVALLARELNAADWHPPSPSPATPPAAPPPPPAPSPAAAAATPRRARCASLASIPEQLSPCAVCRGGPASPDRGGGASAAEEAARGPGACGAGGWELSPSALDLGDVYAQPTGAASAAAAAPRRWAALTLRNASARALTLAVRVDAARGAAPRGCGDCPLVLRLVGAERGAQHSPPAASVLVTVQPGAERRVEVACSALATRAGGGLREVQGRLLVHALPAAALPCEGALAFGSGGVEPAARGVPVRGVVGHVRLQAQHRVVTPTPADARPGWILAMVPSAEPRPAPPRPAPPRPAPPRPPHRQRPAAGRGRGRGWADACARGWADACARGWADACARGGRGQVSVRNAGSLPATFRAALGPARRAREGGCKGQGEGEGEGWGGAAHGGPAGGVSSTASGSPCCSSRAETLEPLVWPASVRLVPGGGATLRVAVPGAAGAAGAAGWALRLVAAEDPRLAFSVPLRLPPPAPRALPDMPLKALQDFAQLHLRTKAAKARAHTAAAAAEEAEEPAPPARGGAPAALLGVVAPGAEGGGGARAQWGCGGPGGGARVEFPATRVGRRSVVEVALCNHSARPAVLHVAPRLILKVSPPPPLLPVRARPAPVSSVAEQRPAPRLFSRRATPRQLRGRARAPLTGPGGARRGHLAYASGLRTRRGRAAAAQSRSRSQRRAT